MKNSSNVFLGVFLIVVGSLFFAGMNDWFGLDISFSQIARFWPVLIILAGIAVFLNDRRSVGNPLSVLLVAFAIPLGIYSFASEGVKEIKNNFEDEFHFDFDDDFNHENLDGDYNDDQTDEEDNSISSKQKGDRTEQLFDIEKDNGIEEARLKLGGGAAEFHLSESNDKLFEARTLLKFGNYKLSDEKKGNLHEIDFEMKNNKKSFKFGDNDNNEVFLKLNKKPVWDIEMGIGAGDLDFDLSGYKVKKLEIKTGAASVDVKLGDQMENTDVKIESGVASVEIGVPKGVGCQIDMDGALNSKDFDGFQKKNDKYETENFNSAGKKIFIRVSSGLSSVKVNRY